MYKTFTKDMLENGMIIKNREGEFRLMLNNCLIGEIHYGTLDNYSADLRSITNSNFDVMEVYAKIDVLRDINPNNRATVDKNPIWVREEIKEVTIAEIEEKFGCKVKIIKDKNT